jgi:N-acetylmuramoyl-L-alanine amidase
MARLLLVLLGALMLLGGCQQPKSTLITPLPSAYLDGPVVVAPPATPHLHPAPQARAPRPRQGDVPSDWIPPIAANSWRWIVIHHSATPAGNAAQFDREHRRKGWDELGYHFVIGNGTGSRDGQIEVGSRWPKQKWGAHARTSSQEFNNFGIGICLVGNFDIERPTPAQTKALAKLVAHLMKTYHVSADRVLGHGDTKPTDCPGRNVSLAEVRRMAAQMVSDTSFVEEEPVRTASMELLREVQSR